MAKVKVVESTGRFIETAVVPDGVYIARLHQTKEGKITFRGEERPIIRWFFQILSENPEINGKIVEGITSPTVSTRSKAYRWLTALLGEKPDPETEIDLDDYIGNIVQVQVETKTSQSGREYSRVINVVPATDVIKKIAKDLIAQIPTDEDEIDDYDTDSAEEDEEVEEIVVKPKPKKKAKKK